MNIVALREFSRVILSKTLQSIPLHLYDIDNRIIIWETNGNYKIYVGCNIGISNVRSINSEDL